LLEEPQVFATAALVVGMLAGLILGLILGRSRRRSDVATNEVDRIQARLTRAEKSHKEQVRQLRHLRGEQSNVASLAMSLPEIVRELNSSKLDAKTAPRLIMNLANSIFKPEQILLYVVPPSTDGGPAKRELLLLSQKGLAKVPDEIRRVPFGHGKIGWAAEHKLDKLDSDWFKLSRAEGVTVPNNHPALKLDIVGPLQHFGDHGDEVLGVLCLGAPAIRPQDEKLMFQLVTNLGSLALVNVRNLKRLRNQANTDGLTGLLNKRHLLKELANQVIAAENQAQTLGVFIFDIDHFKNFNDTNGHPAGDDLLRQLAQLLRETLRPNDWCCRYGGEEFMVIMPQTGPKEAMEIAEGIRRAIDERVFPHQENQPTGNLTISGGVAVFPTGGSSSEELIKHADSALYESKHSGRNRVTQHHSVSFGELNANESEIDLPPVPDGMFRGER